MRPWQRLCEALRYPDDFERQQEYVRTFDFDRRASLHLRYHTFGATWQNVCARKPGSTRGSDVGASTVPDVPQLATASPGVTAPTPAAPHALSAPPPTTGVPTGTSPSARS